jgi:chromosome segregation ATPase
LTYKGLAAALCIDEESARRRAQRRKWPRREGNDGRVRVAVPADLLAHEREAATRDDALDAAPDATRDASRGVARDMAATLAKLAAVRTLAEERLRRIEDQERQLDETRQTAATAREHAARLEGELGALRAGLAAAEARTATLLEEAVEHRAERNRLAAEIEMWTAGGPLARAWRALLNRQVRP